MTFLKTIGNTFNSCSSACFNFAGQHPILTTAAGIAAITYATTSAISLGTPIALAVSIAMVSTLAFGFVEAIAVFDSYSAGRGPF